MNNNLRGNVKIRGTPIEDFIRAVVRQQTPEVPNLTKNNDLTQTNQGMTENLITEVINERMKSLDAFQDEKKIINSSLSELSDKVRTTEHKIEGMQGDIERMKGDIEGMIGNIEGVKGNIGTEPDLKTELQRELKGEIQREIERLSKLIEKLDKKVTDVKPRRGVDQNTLDTAIADIQNTFEFKINQISESFLKLRNELEE